MDNRNSLCDVADLVYLTPENAAFRMKGEFPAARINERMKTESGSTEFSPLI